MREYTDVPPLAQLPDASTATASAEAAAAIMQQKQTRRSENGLEASKQSSNGTPRETDWQKLNGHANEGSEASVAAASSNRSAALVRPGLRLTTDRTKRQVLINAMVSWNVHFKPV